MCPSSQHFLIYNLFIRVAKRSSRNTHRLIDSHGRTENSPIHSIIQSDIGRWRSVQESASTTESVLSVCGVKSLPDGPDTINHSVMEIESGISRRSKLQSQWAPCFFNGMQILTISEPIGPITKCPPPWTPIAYVPGVPDMVFWKSAIVALP